MVAAQCPTLTSIDSPHVSWTTRTFRSPLQSRSIASALLLVRACLSTHATRLHARILAGEVQGHFEEYLALSGIPCSTKPLVTVLTEFAFLALGSTSDHPLSKALRHRTHLPQGHSLRRSTPRNLWARLRMAVYPGRRASSKAVVYGPFGQRAAFESEDLDWVVA